MEQLLHVCSFLGRDSLAVKLFELQKCKALAMILSVCKGSEKSQAAFWGLYYSYAPC